ncbi:DUF4087 domain-containing protein [Lysobacter auxotrophicus]|uniref:DUF4087 domain-containing protein n=1 Tax=Lysobacter auxotrophicus TaxID=2992573 RepID=UPI003CCE34A5
MKRFAFALLLSMPQWCLAGDLPDRFSGDWVEVTQGDSAGETPYSTFELHLIAKDKRLMGSYCYVTRHGAKIDCDPAESNLSGVVSTDGKTASVKFSSTFGATGGVALLSRNGEQLSWKLLTVPTGGAFYGPRMASLIAENREEKRCGWLSLSRSSEVSLRDRDGSWSVTRKGPDGGLLGQGGFRRGHWVRTDDTAGYGCACVRAKVNKVARRIFEVSDVQSQPLSRCFSDPGLKGMNP